MKKILFISILGLTSSTLFAQTENNQTKDEQERIAWKAKLEIIQAENAQLQKQAQPVQETVAEKKEPSTLQRNDGVDPALKPNKVENIDQAARSRAILLPDDRAELQRRENEAKK